MKSYTYIIGCLGFCLLLLLPACVQEELQRVPNEGEGILKLGIASVVTEVSSTTETKTETISLPEGIKTPSDTDFRIDVYQGTDLKIENAQRNQEYVLATGTYTIKVTPTDASNPDLVSTTPPAYFEGSETIEVKPLQVNTASVTVYWGYSILNVTLSDELAFHLQEYSLDVTVGGTNYNYSFTENNTVVPLYILGGRSTTVTLKGTNYVGETVSSVLLAEDELPRATQYDVKVGVKDLEAFDLVESVTAAHTYESGVLTGTDVTLNIADNIPKELISSWTATLTFGESTIRTYSSSSSLKDVSSVTMGGKENMIYIPQNADGWDCKLSYSYTLNGKEYTGEQDVKVTVAAPNLSLTFAPYTSYTKYKEGSIDAANNCMNNVIYNLNASVNVSNELMSLWGGTLNYTYEGTTETSSTNAISKGDVTVSSWKSYSASASFSFDGVTQTISKTLDITGLPYKAEPPKSVSSDSMNGWVTGDGNAFNWESSYLQLGISGGQQNHTVYKEYNIPADINVTISGKISAHNAPVTTTCSILLGEETVMSVTADGGAFSYDTETTETSVSKTMTTSSNKITLKNSYSVTRSWGRIYYVKVYYR